MSTDAQNPPKAEASDKKKKPAAAGAGEVFNIADLGKKM
jgi:hypothetical protein